MCELPIGIEVTMVRLDVQVFCVNISLQQLYARIAV